MSNENTKTELINETIVNESLTGLYATVASFSIRYGTIHAHLSVFLCLIGFVCNSCTVVVLWRPRMRSPVNAILASMAVSNNFMTGFTLIFTGYSSFVISGRCGLAYHSWAWAVFVVLHAQITLVAHSCSVWFSVSMAAVRIKIMRSRCARQRPIGMKDALYVVVAVVVVVIVLNIPNCLLYSIRLVPPNDWFNGWCHSPLSANISAASNNQDNREENFAYVPWPSYLAEVNNRIMVHVAFWITGCAFKIVPCTVLPLLIFWLVQILNEISNRRVRLNKLNPCSGQTVSKGTDPNHTTRMLMLIVCVFLITELPQGAMAVLVGLLGEHFQQNVYHPLADFLDMLALTNSCATFVIYTCMSEMFRQEVIVRDTFCPGRIASQYNRVEHRGSIVPETPIFAALRQQVKFGARNIMTKESEENDELDTTDFEENVQEDIMYRTRTNSCCNANTQSLSKNSTIVIVNNHPLTVDRKQQESKTLISRKLDGDLPPNHIENNDELKYSEYITELFPDGIVRAENDSDSENMYQEIIV